MTGSIIIIRPGPLADYDRLSDDGRYPRAESIEQDEHVH